MRKVIFKILSSFFVLYILMCGLLYVFQEKFIFFPQKLDQSYTFSFEKNYEEITIVTEDQTNLHGLLFKSAHSKGLIFYLHGNAGSLKSWGNVAQVYTNMNYDIFLLDYRGYGKSKSSISSEEQLYQDVQVSYNEMLKLYSEDKISVIGYSIGTGLAAQLASRNQPDLLILQAPFYSLTDLMERTYPIVPSCILTYKFETNEYLKACKMPIVIFHGNQDKLINYNSSVKLKEENKSSCRLIILNGQGHNGMTDNPDYRDSIEKILSK